MSIQLKPPLEVAEAIIKDANNMLEHSKKVFDVGTLTVDDAPILAALGAINVNITLLRSDIYLLIAAVQALHRTLENT